MDKKNLLPGVILVLLGLTYSFYLGKNCGIKSGNLCIQPYWLDHWLINYSQGFTRRGILGELTSKLLGSQLNIIFLNLFCLAITLTIFFLIFSRLYKSISTNNSRIGTFFILTFLAATPLTSVFFETLGDPLQVILLCYLLIFPFIISLERKLFRVIVTSITVIISALIHEASLFLFLPAYILAVQKDFYPLYKQYLLLFFIFLIAMFAILFKTPSMSPTKIQLLTESYKAFNPITGLIHKNSGFQQSLTFLELLEQERQLYFSNYRSTFEFIIKPFKTLWIPLCSFLVISRSAGNKILNTSFIRIWILLMICSFPLYIIAHDWGRFAVYSFWIAFYSANILTNDSRNHDNKSVGIHEVKLANFPYIDPFVAALVLLMFITYPISPEYRIAGIRVSNFLSCIPIFIGILVLILKNFDLTLVILQKEFFLVLPTFSNKKELKHYI